MAIAIGIVSAILLYLYLRYRRAARRDGMRLATARQALQGCEHLLVLLRAMQQHRGLSSGWLAGERQFEGRMLARRHEAERELIALAEIAHAELAKPRPCFTPHDVSLFRFRWKALVDELSGLSIEQSIARHSQLISHALDWLAALGEARIELPVADQVEADSVRNYANRLPLLAEYLGQARAVGSGVAARGSCTPVARVRLMFLTSRSEALLKQAMQVSGDRQAMVAAQAVAALTEMVRQKLLAERAVAIDAESYFAAATAAIDAVFAWIEACGAEIRRELEAGRTGEAVSVPERAAGMV